MDRAPGRLVTGRGKERFLARQRRRIVHARFRGPEVVLPGYPAGTSLDGYRRSGRVTQFFERGWALLVTLSGFSMLLGGVLVIGQPLGWQADIGGAAFGAVGAYMGFHHLAAWRCLRRHRTRSPRKR